jgi:hypothetical protein
MGFSYDLTKYPALSQARLCASDSNIDAYLFEDAEIQWALDRNNGVPELAAAYLLEFIATDKAHIANTIKIGSYGKTVQTVSQALAERAAALRAMAPVSPVCNAPDAIFTTASDGGTVPGTMDIW